MSKAGKLTQIKKSGSSTAFTTEACTLISGKKYKITDRTKKVWNESVGVTVYDDGSPVSASNIEKISYLVGYVEFTSGYSPTTPITVTGEYMPMTAITQVNEVTMDIVVDNGDSTTYSSANANSNFRSKITTENSATGTLSGFYDNSEDLYDILNNDTDFYLDINFDINSPKSYVMMAKINSDSYESSVDGIANNNYSFESTTEVYKEV